MAKAKATKGKKALEGDSIDGVTLVDLTDEEVRKLAKPLAGFESFVDDLLGLATKNAALRGKVDVAKAHGDAAVWSSFEKPQQQAEKHAEMIRETRLQSGSSVWKAMLAIYGRAQKSDDPADRRAVAGFAAFLKKGPRKEKKANPAPTK